MATFFQTKEKADICNKTMEACVVVDRELDRVVKQLRATSGSAAAKLQKLLDQISELKAKLGEGKSRIIPEFINLLTLLFSRCRWVSTTYI